MCFLLFPAGSRRLLRMAWDPGRGVNLAACHTRKSSFRQKFMIVTRTNMSLRSNAHRSQEFNAPYSENFSLDFILRTETKDFQHMLAWKIAHAERVSARNKIFSFPTARLKRKILVSKDFEPCPLMLELVHDSRLWNCTMEKITISLLFFVPSCTRTQSDQVTSSRNCERDLCNGGLTKLVHYRDSR